MHCWQQCTSALVRRRRVFSHSQKEAPWSWGLVLPALKRGVQSTEMKLLGVKWGGEATSRPEEGREESWKALDCILVGSKSAYCAPRGALCAFLLVIKGNRGAERGRNQAGWPKATLVVQSRALDWSGAACGRV